MHSYMVILLNEDNTNVIEKTREISLVIISSEYNGQYKDQYSSMSQLIAAFPCSPLSKGKFPFKIESFKFSFEIFHYSIDIL